MSSSVQIAIARRIVASHESLYLNNSLHARVPYRSQSRRVSSQRTHNIRLEDASRIDQRVDGNMR